MADPINGRPATARNPAMGVAASALRAQQSRMRVIAENIANANSTATTPGGDPYRRKTVSFETLLDAKTGAETVALQGVGRDQSAFRLSHDPAHPAADANGYVKLPNVQPLIEMANMREASRSYEANLNMVETGRRMNSQIIDLLG